MLLVVFVSPIFFFCLARSLREINGKYTHRENWSRIGFKTWVYFLASCNFSSKLGKKKQTKQKENGGAESSIRDNSRTNSRPSQRTFEMSLLPPITDHDLTRKTCIIRVSFWFWSTISLTSEKKKCCFIFSFCFVFLFSPDASTRQRTVHQHESDTRYSIVSFSTIGCRLSHPLPFSRCLLKKYIWKNHATIVNVFFFFRFPIKDTPT